MASRSVSVGWFLVGFLAGVGATLAAIIFATRPQPTHVALPAPTPPAAAVVTYHAPQIPESAPASLPPLAGPIPPRPQEAGAPPPSPGAGAAPAHSSRTAGPDEQTREDAAAAGMTSRSRAGG